MSFLDFLNPFAAMRRRREETVARQAEHDRLEGIKRQREHARLEAKKRIEYAQHLKEMSGLSAEAKHRAQLRPQSNVTPFHVERRPASSAPSQISTAIDKTYYSRHQDAPIEAFQAQQVQALISTIAESSRSEPDPVKPSGYCGYDRTSDSSGGGSSSSGGYSSSSSSGDSGAGSCGGGSD